VKADWYFDFISPFAYLQFARLGELESEVGLAFKPILFAALLDHWGQLGPAEIAPKRAFTYAHVSWLARRQGVVLNVPEAHPFNPLRLLRLALHLECRRESIARLFAFVWQQGHIPENEPAWRDLVRELGVNDAEAAIARPEIKAALRRNTDEAIAAGVFGVPTLVVSSESGGPAKTFWGYDATQMVLDYLAEPEPFRRDDVRIAQLPAASVRPATRRT
jgi:2-hydroxychromene-2-carboxylate isomerase